jgi:hypothetical protein
MLMCSKSHARTHKRRQTLFEETTSEIGKTNGIVVPWLAVITCARSTPSTRRTSVAILETALHCMQPLAESPAELVCKAISHSSTCHISELSRCPPRGRSVLHSSHIRKCVKHQFACWRRTTKLSLNSDPPFVLWRV